MSTGNELYANFIGPRLSDPASTKSYHSTLVMTGLEHVPLCVAARMSVGQDLSWRFAGPGQLAYKMAHYYHHGQQHDGPQTKEYHVAETKPTPGPLDL